MKSNWVKCLIALVIFAVIGTVTPTRAQDKTSAGSDAKRSDTALKVTVVVTEVDGNKKISTLPYTFYVNVDDTSKRTTSSVRMGLRVPVTTGSAGAPNAPTQFQYMDIGTNLDCSANSTLDSRYKLALSVDRTSLSAPDDKKSSVSAGDGLNISSTNPIIQHFSSSYNLMIHDGQTIEATSTSDPISGHVLQISVTVNAVK
jgi:hypothetical protein